MDIIRAVRERMMVPHLQDDVVPPPLKCCNMPACNVGLSRRSFGLHVVLDILDEFCICVIRN